MLIGGGEDLEGAVGLLDGDGEFADFLAGEARADEGFEGEGVWMVVVELDGCGGLMVAGWEWTGVGVLGGRYGVDFAVGVGVFGDEGGGGG